MKKIFYEKLVRDFIPRKILRKGSSLLTRTLDSKQFKAELIRKLSEESVGVANSQNRGELVMEIGDVLDVIDAIRKEFKIKPGELAKSRAQTRKTKGGFAKRIYLIWSSKDDYRSNETPVKLKASRRKK